MKKLPIVLAFLLLSSLAFSQNVATINNKGITSKEFMWIYKRNHTNASAATYEGLYNYLNLYIEFKLKVLDARTLKLEKDTAYINEMTNYEQALKAKSRVGKEEFQFLLNEYREGVLMFNVSELKIWNSEKISDESATFEEQQALERKWIENLRLKYPVKIDEKELRKLAKI